LRVFLDTTVLVSAFVSRGLSADIFRIILKEHELIVGDVVLAELNNILLNKFSMPEASVKNILTYLNRFEIHSYVNEPSPVELRDKDDEKILALAIKSKAAVLVTGDKDLLDVKNESPIEVATPREFLELVKAG